MTRQHFSTLELWVEAVAARVADILRADLADNPMSCLAVPGGRTAATVLPALAERGLDWSRIPVTLVDERWVDPTHANSNERLARELLGESVAVIGLYTGDATPDVGMIKASARIENLLPLGCVLLGMGEDGHIASLFPGMIPKSAVLQTVARSDHPRISMTPKTLLSAREIVLAVAGAEKCAQIDRALQPGPADVLPVRYVLDQDQTPVSIFTV